MERARQAGERWFGGRRWVGAALFFAILGVVMTWPLVLHMGSALAGRIGDNIYFVWMIGWVQKALFELGTNPFDVWFLNYPEGWNMAYTEITPAMLGLALPFSLVGGATFGYNAAMLLSYALSGLFMFLWVRKLTGSWGAGLVAGTVFACLPYRTAHFLIGHLNLSGTMWLPLFFWGLHGALEDTGRAGRKAAVLGGVGLGLTALTSQYYLYMALLVGAVFAAAYLLDDVWTQRKARSGWRLAQRNFWAQMVILGLAALPLTALGVGPYVALNQQGGLPDRDIAVTRRYSASPTDFLLPSTDHFLWGRWVGEHFNRELWVEATLYVGAAAGALALLALMLRRRGGHRRLVVSLFWAGAAAVVLAMGTDLHWLSEPVRVSVPGFLQGVLGRTEIPLVHLPGYYLFDHFPFYAKLRALMRFGLFALLFVSVGAGLGAAQVLGRTAQRWKGAVLLGMLALVLLDFYPGPVQEFAPVQARPVDTALAQRPGQGAVIQFPFILSEDQEQTYYTLEHGKPFVGGFFNAFPPPQYARIRPVMEQFPSAESIAMLPELGVEFVIAAAGAYPDLAQVRQPLEAAGYEYLGLYGDQALFEKVQKVTP